MEFFAVAQELLNKGSTIRILSMQQQAAASLRIAGATLTAAYRCLKVANLQK